MYRLARADVPHHVTQRGNRRQPTFFCDDDYGLYRDRIAESCRAVRPGLVRAAAVWPWPSAGAHLEGRSDRLVDVRPLLDRAPDGRSLRDSALPQADYEPIRRGESRCGRNKYSVPGFLLVSPDSSLVSPDFPCVP